MNKCIVKGCNRRVFKTITATQGSFGGRKQGMFIVKYPLCREHEQTRLGDVDQKKFLEVNPHCMGT